MNEAAAKKIHFTIPGEPHGKGRPQFATINGHVTARTPKKTVVYENLVKLEYQRQCGKQRFDDDAMLSVSVLAYYEIPKSASRKRQAAMAVGHIRPTKKPDADNCIKSILDSLNKIAYRDDAQVVDVEFRKYYDADPRVEVTISITDVLTRPDPCPQEALPGWGI